MKLKNIKIGDYIEAKNNDSDMIQKGQSYKVVMIDIDGTVAVCIPNVQDIWWVDPADFRKPRTKLKQLDQSVFDGLDEKWRFAVIQNNGLALVCTKFPFVTFGGSSWYWNGYSDVVGKGYDASDWQNSLVERESEELTGDDLCRAMLARGDIRVMCEVYDDGNRNNLTHVIREYRDDKFHTKANRWSHAIPINNQGKRLTAAEAGL